MTKAYLKNSLGFGLLQTMVSVGVMSVVGLGVAKMMSNNAHESKYLNAKSRNHSLTTELQSILSNSKLCQQTFQGKGLPSATEDLVLSEVQLPRGVKITSGENLEEYGLHIGRIYLQKKPIYAGKSPSTQRQLYQTKLMIETGLLNRDGQSTDNRTLKATPIGTFVAETNTSGQIVDCSTLQSENDLLKKSCTEMGGVFVEGTGCDMTAFQNKMKESMCLSLGGIFDATNLTCGLSGLNGRDGTDGLNGLDGLSGLNGTNGYNTNVTLPNGTTYCDGLNRYQIINNQPVRVGSCAGTNPGYPTVACVGSSLIITNIDGTKSVAGTCGSGGGGGVTYTTSCVGTQLVQIGSDGSRSVVGNCDPGRPTVTYTTSCVNTQLVQVGSDGSRSVVGACEPVRPCGVTRSGTATGNSINGTDCNDTLVGLAGTDTIKGGLGNDTIRGGRGSDTLIGGKGSDTLLGGRGADSINGGRGSDTISGGFGADTLTGGRGADTVSGGTGRDTISGGQGRDVVSGGGGADTIRGGAGADTISGGRGADTIYAGSGHDTIRAGAGADRVVAGAGDTIKTGAGADRVVLTLGSGQSATVDGYTVKQTNSGAIKVNGQVVTPNSNGVVTLSNGTKVKVK